MTYLLEHSPVLFALVGAADADPPLYIGVDLLLFTLIVFVVLLFVLRKYAWNPIVEGLDKREKAIADEINDAQLANEKAQANLAQYEQRLQAASEEANKLLADAKQEAEKAKERIVAEAGQEAQRQRDRAIAEINAAKDQAVRDLAERSVDSAVTLAGNMVGKELSRSDHEKLIDQSLAQF